MASLPIDDKGCADSLVIQVSEPNDDENSKASIEEILHIETYDEDVFELKPTDSLSCRSSYSNQEKPKSGNTNVKNRQMVASKSVIERPKTAREKANVNVKASMKIHKLGTIPLYLKNKKEMILSKASSITIEKPSTASSVESYQKINVKKKEQGDVVQSSTSVVVNEAYNNEIENLKTQILTKINKITNLRSQIVDLKTKSDSLTKQLNEAKSERDKSDNELKSSLDKIKNLELKISRSYGEQKKFVDKTAKMEIEIANLIKEKQDLLMKIGVAEEENAKLQTQLEKSQIDLRAKSDSFEKLITQNHHLQAMLDHESKCDEVKDSINEADIQLKTLKDENEALKNNLDGKMREITDLKEDKHNLIDEIKHLKSQVEKQPVDFNKQNSSDKIVNLQNKIQEMSKNEEELKQRILTLNSKLEDERYVTVRNNVLLECRQEYIKALQDVDNNNKARLVLHAKEIEDLRKQIKNFDIFKEAHAEEKSNFKMLLKKMETENTRLKTKLEMYEKKINFENRH